MRWSRRRGTLLAPLLFLLLLSASAMLAPTASAQQDEQFFGLQMTPDRGSVSVDYLGTQLVNITLEDVSISSTVQENPSGATVILRTEVVGQPRGWQASVSSTQVFLRSGEQKDIVLNIQAGATIEEPRAEIRVNAVYRAPNGEERPTNVSVLAVALPNPVVRMQMEGAPPQLAPYDRVQVPVRVSNDDYYPEMIAFTVQDVPEGWVVIPPDSIQLGPGEEETVFMTVRAPQTPWFTLNPSSETVTLSAQTLTNEGGRFAIGVPATLTGSYIPGWIVPHAILLLIGSAMVITRTSRKFKQHRLKKGKPSFPGVPPEKEARFEAMKHTDPERAEEVEQRLENLYDKRVAAWKDDYKERKKSERERRKRMKERHDAILEKKREETQRRREAERRKREQMERRKAEREELVKKRRELKERQQKALEEREAELAEQMRQEREQAADASDLEAKRRRLEELRERKRALDEDDAEGS